MADEKPRTGAGSDNPGSKQKPLVCAEWEAMLVDALDGTLSAKDAAAFEVHRATCAACEQLLAEAKRGGEWLRFLETEPEVPSDMVARILATTSGAVDMAMPVVPAIARVPADFVQPGWLPGLERHAAQSRWIMTAAMAFFSIAFTLNLTGVKLGGLQLSDLTPNNLALSLKRQFYVADAGVVRYYNNLRFVYELESRVRQMKRDVAPTDSRNNSVQDAAPAPSTENSQPQPKKPNGGSAEKISPRTQPSAPPSDWFSDQEEPVMASFHRNPVEEPCHIEARTVEAAAVAKTFAVKQQKEAGAKETCSETYGTKKDRAERSLA